MVRLEVVFRITRLRRLTEDEQRVPGLVLHRWLDHLLRRFGRGDDGRIALAAAPCKSASFEAEEIVSAAISVFTGGISADEAEQFVDAVLLALMELAATPAAPLHPVRINATNSAGIAQPLWHEDDGADWVEAATVSLDPALLVQLMPPSSDDGVLVIETLTPLSITSNEKRTQRIAVAPTATRVVKAALRRLTLLWPETLPVVLGGGTVFDLEGLAMQLDRDVGEGSPPKAEAVKDGTPEVLHYGSTKHADALVLPVFSGTLYWQHATPLAPLMHLAQWTQLGRGTAMGLGVVRVR